MAPPQILEDAPEADDPEGNFVAVDENTKIEEYKKELHSLCIVLGTPLDTKLAEFGKSLSSKRLAKAIKFLTETRDTNFNELKKASEEIMRAWVTYNTKMSEIEPLAWIMSIHDAEHPNEVTGKKLLSTPYVTRAENEVTKLKKERELELQSKYRSHVKKFENLLKECHLTPADFFYQVNKEVDIMNYDTQKVVVKNAIKEVKQELGKRKELIIRMELLKRTVKKNPSSQLLQGLVQNVQKAAQKLMELEEEEDVPYDGQTVEKILEDMMKASEGPEAPQNEPPLNLGETLPTWTRSGRMRGSRIA